MLDDAFPKGGPFTPFPLPPRDATHARVRCIIVHDERKEVAGRLPVWNDPWQVIGTLSLPGGEGIKNLEVLTQLWNYFSDCGADKHTYIICIGGGSLSDLVGFAAGTYHRGLPLIFIPTTVLSMVDAAIGGKNGINWQGVKNQIGMRHMPEQIVIQAHWLETLPRMEQLSGWIEMAKHALTENPTTAAAFLDEPGPNPENLKHWIPISARFKWTVVVSDADENGERKVLNFGHTVGHALEALAQREDRAMPHGIAVAWGMETALHLSVALRGLPPERAQRAIRKLRSWLEGELPPDWEGERIWPYMLKDKKNAHGQVLEVLLHDWGQPEWNCPVRFEDFARAWRQTQSGPLG
jgi:3-dehydroquinate synthase